MMPWCEYVLKSIAYHRMDKEWWKKFRMVGYSARVGSHYEPPKSEESFMPLGERKATNDMKEKLAELRKIRAKQK